MDEEKGRDEINNTTPLVLSESSANIKTQQTALLAILLIDICTGVGVYLFNEYPNGTTSTITTTTTFQKKVIHYPLASTDVPETQLAAP